MDALTELYLHNNLHSPRGLSHYDFLNSAAQNDIEYAERYLSQRDANINFQSQLDGCSALHLAAKNEQLDFMYFLLDDDLHKAQKVNITLQDNIGNTILHYICSSLVLLPMLPKIISELKNRNQLSLVLNTKNTRGETVLIQAVRAGNTGLVKYLLDLKADVNVADNSGMTALHYSVKNLSILKLLVLHKASLTAQENSYSYTPLHYAICIGRFRAAGYLIEKAIDSSSDVLEIKDSHGNSPLLACVESYISVNNYLYYKNNKLSIEQCKRLMANAISSNNTSATEQLSKFKHLDSSQSEDIRECYYRLMIKLIDCGVCVDVQDNMKSNPLIYAAANNDRSLVSLFLKSGANPNIRDMCGYQPVDLTRDSRIKHLISLSQNSHRKQMRF